MRSITRNLTTSSWGRGRRAADVGAATSQPATRQTATRQAGAVRVTGLFAVVALSITTVVGLSAGGAQADGPQDIPLQVVVTATPTTGAAGSSGGGGASGGSGASGGTAGNDAAVVVDDAATAATAAPEAELAGLLAVSGLQTSVRPSLNPAGGGLHIHMSVQNLSSTVVSPTVAFSLTNAFGQTLSRQATASFGDIAPGEIQVAEADLGRVGQWGVVVAHMHLVPPAQLEGVELTALDRSQWVLVPPWALLILVLLGGAVVSAWRWSRRVPHALAVAVAGAR